MKLPGSNTWAQGICEKQVAPRSYLVECKGHFYRHNHRHLQRAHNTTPVQNDVDWNESDSEEGEEREGNTEQTEPTDLSEARPQNANGSAMTLPPTTQHQTSSFGRVIKPTRWYIEQTDT